MAIIRLYKNMNLETLQSHEGKGLPLLQSEMMLYKIKCFVWKQFKMVKIYKI
jgi:hypothetical protein